VSIAIEPDAPARDSELLSHVLHEALLEQAGEELARTVQWLHEPANEPRNGDAAGRRESLMDAADRLRADGAAAVRALHVELGRNVAEGPTSVTERTE